MINEERITMDELVDANHILQAEIDQIRKEYDGIADRLLEAMTVGGKMRKLLSDNNIEHEN